MASPMKTRAANSDIRSFSRRAWVRTLAICVGPPRQYIRDVVRQTAPAERSIRMRGIRRALGSDELKDAFADGGRFAEHLRLKLTRLVPGRLPAHRRVEREQEPPAVTALNCRSGARAWPRNA